MAALPLRIQPDLESFDLAGAARFADGAFALVAPSACEREAAIAAAPAGAVVFSCERREYAGDGRSGSIASLTIAPAALLRRRAAAASPNAILFVVPRAWLSRAAEGVALVSPQRCATTFYLPEELNGIAAAALEGRFAGYAAELYRAARCQELLCEIVQAWGAGKLVARAANGAYSLADAERLMQARQIIATRYAEKLTLESIARACGLNRAKLTQGFRELFNQSVAEALAEQRLLWAARELRTSGKPVALVGYAAGYLNNASFARAFSKRFGQCPSDFRRADAAPALTRLAA
jgi:AraC family transcriptional activator of pyochelin receptor